MGIAWLALTGLLKRLSSPHRAGPMVPARPVGRIHPVWTARPASCTSVVQKPVGVPAPSSGLRSLRIRESDQQAECAGRMVISGRMADVCAELDRLVALESRQSSR